MSNETESILQLQGPSYSIQRSRNVELRREEMGEDVPHDLNAGRPPFPAQPAQVLAGVKLGVQRQLFEYRLRVMDNSVFVVLYRCDANLGIMGRPPVSPLTENTPYDHQLILDAQVTERAACVTDSGLKVGVDVVLDWGSHRDNYNNILLLAQP